MEICRPASGLQAGESCALPARLPFLTVCANTEQWLDAIGDPSWRLFTSLWSSHAKQAGGIPSREHLDPVAMPRLLLPNLFLVDVVEKQELQFRLRLVGTEITRYEGERTGNYVENIGPREDLIAVFAQYRACLDGKVSVRHDSLKWCGHPYVKAHVLVLPLAHGNRVNMLIGLATYEY